MFEGWKVRKNFTSEMIFIYAVKKIKKNVTWKELKIKKMKKIVTWKEEVEVAPLSGGENPGGVAHKHPPGDHHHGHDCDRGDRHGDCDDCDNFDNIPINSDEGGEEVGQKGDAEGVGRSEGAVLPFQSLEVQTDKGPQTEPPF